ncbi:MAG: 50S ribosomal protein L24 [Nitrosomonas sp.]|nr:MAG: 50S ribosomal protein L24 [Nitrosomonas sp.]
MKKIRKGDDIIVIAGKDKGKRASVTSVIGSNKVLIQGVNIVKKHQKPNPSTGASGGIVEIAKPIDISNIAIFNFSTKKADKIGFKVDNNQKKRIFRSSGELVDN